MAYAGRLHPGRSNTKTEIMKRVSAKTEDIDAADITDVDIGDRKNFRHTALNFKVGQRKKRMKTRTFWFDYRRIVYSEGMTQGQTYQDRFWGVFCVQ